ncbi:MAG: aspartate/glutamate racemase family protein [Ferruginibacter sp.]
MKTIGLVGGTGWVSTLDYYRYFNELVYKNTNGECTAEVLINSVNYPAIAKLTAAGQWHEIAKIITDAAIAMQNAGAACILLGANTMHNIAPQVKAAIDIPFIHIAEETGKEILKQGIKKVALLGTKYTMQLPFFKNVLASMNIETIIPNEEDMLIINDGIYKELSLGIITNETKEKYLQIMQKLRQNGAEGIILGCTEIPLLIKENDFDLPLFDTTFIHSKAAVEFSLG